MKNVIGIPAWSLGENSFGVQKAYLEYLSNFGQVEILTPNNKIRYDLDLVVLPGGADTMSHTYNEAPGFSNSMADPYKDYFAKVNLPQYIEAKIPVFGICLGMQQIAVHFGVPLIQDISSDHGYSDDKGSLVSTCKVNLEQISKMYEETYNTNHTFKSIYKVNSYHHQGISLDQLNKNPNLIPLLVGKNLEYTHRNGNHHIVEAFMHSELNIIGVQYHPERMSYDPFSDLMIQYLLSKSLALKAELAKLLFK